MSGTDTAAMVPGRFDVVIDGHGYCFLDSLESSIPFRTHRAIYGQTQPFVERQNVSNSYGDNAQDFFLTIRQRDWSLGEQQKYFRSTQDGRYWMGSNVDVSIPGQVTLSQQMPALSMAATVKDGAREATLQNIVVASASTMYRVSQSGVVTSLGAHGLGAIPSAFGMVGDGNYTYLSTTGAGSVGVRRWDGASFATFSASPADALMYLNNTLYGIRNTSNDLVRYDTGGTLTSLFIWKDASGGAGGPILGKIEAFGGKLLILVVYGGDVGAELWLYDGTGAFRLEVFPSNFYAHDVEVLYGVAYVSGSFFKPASSSTVITKPAVLFYDGSQVGKLWDSGSFGSQTFSTGNLYSGVHPALGVSDSRLIFTDETTGNVMAYNPALGGVSTIGSVATGGDSVRIVTSGTHIVLMRDTSTAYYYPSVTTNTSGYVTSSLVDFDSSLAKVFRGVTLEFDPATDGNGGSIDIAYQVNSLTGVYTSLATGVTSGTEVLFPANTSGHSVSIKITLNKGTSTAGPTLKSMSIRGAPTMPIYPRGEYIIDCTGSVEQPRELRDGALHPLGGYDQVANLVAARNNVTPITITDKVSGTFTGYIDVNDPQGFDVYEVRSGLSGSAPTKPGSYVVRLTVRGV